MTSPDPTPEQHAAELVQGAIADAARDGVDPLETVVFQALGRVSVCWSEIPTGVFDSSTAKAVGDALVGFVRSRS